MAGHKRMDFVMNLWRRGWPTNRSVRGGDRPARASPCASIQTTRGDIPMRYTMPQCDDVTERMNAFCRSVSPNNRRTLGRGLLCVQNRPQKWSVRLYDEKGNRGRKAGTGPFTAAMMDKYPRCR